MKTKLFILLTALGLASASSSAATIATWDVDGIDVGDGTGIDQSVSPFAFSADSTLTGIQSAKLQLSSTVNPSTSSSQYGAKVSTDQTNLADAITAGHYIELVITVASGYQLNLTSIEMNGQTSGTGWSDAAFMSSIAGYTAGNELDSVSGIAGTTGGLDTDVSGWGAPIDLSSASYQGLTGTTSFRIYGFGSTSGSGVSYIRNLGGDDLVVNGSVIPEPASIMLMGLVGMASVMVLRKRK